MSPRPAAKFCLSFIFAALSFGARFDAVAQPIEIASWDFAGLANFGASPLAPTTTAANVTVVGLTRGAGVSATGSAAANAWGGTSWLGQASFDAAVTAGATASFSVAANAGFSLSLSSVSAYNVRRSGSGPAAGQWQYRVGGGEFVNIGAPITWGTVTTGTGNPQTAIDLTTIVALQNVAPGAVVEFRIVNYGASGAGTWYLNSLSAVGADFVLVGTVNSASPDSPTISSFTPGSGASGATVTITGTNFNGATAVAFNSLAAASFSLVNATTITAVVPAGARTGRITVTTANGTATSSSDFIPLDGSGTVAVQNGGLGPFSGKNLFGRSLSGQAVRLVYAPPAAGTVEGLHMTVPAEFGAPLFSNVSVSGTGSAGAVVGVAGQVVTITGLSASSPNTINVDISGLSTPDTATPITNTGRYPFSVDSRGSGGTFAPLANQPSASVLIPLANARNADPTTFVPALLNQLVAVEGVCLVSRLGTGSTSTMLQDGSLGIALYSLSAVVGPQTRGNRYAAVGTIAQFNGVVQVVLSDPALLVDLGAAAEPAPTTVSVTEFNATGVAYQSRVLRIENLSFVSGTWAVGQNVILQDPSANQVTIRIQQNSTATTAPTYPVTITGIGGQFDNASPFNTGFQLQPRDPADLNPATLPSIGVSPSSITSLTATQGAPGPSSSFTASASNLSNNITVTANDVVNFAISTNNTDFTNTLTLLTNSTGGLSNKPVYVRLTGAAPFGLKSNTVTLSSDSISTNVIVTGTVIDLAAPTINPSTNALSGFTTQRGTASTNQTVTVTGTNLGGTSITVTSSNNFYEISTNALVTPFSNSLTLVSTGGIVAVRISSGAPATNSLLGSLALSGGGATNSVVLSGSVTNLPPAVTVSTNSLPAFSSVTNTASAPESFFAQGTNLSANVTVTAPTGFSVAFTSNNADFGASVTLTNSGGVATNREVFVRMNASAATNSLSTRDVTLVTTGASNQVSVSGTITAASPSLSATPASLNNFFAVAGAPSAVTNYILRGSNLSSLVSIAAPAGFQVALTNTNSAFTNTLSITNNGSISNSIWVRVAANASTNTNLTGNITNTAGAAATNVALRATVVPVPTLSAMPTALSNFTTLTGIASTNQSFNLTASNLLGLANLSVTNGYEISTSTNSGFTTNLVLVPIPGWAPFAVAASDSADNYSGGWTTGANGGTGFGPWVITANNGTGFAGAFIGTPTAAGIVTNATFGTNAFGLYANPGASGAFANADRTMPALKVGQTFSFQWAVNWDSDVGNKGFRLYSGGTSGTELLNVNQGGFPGDISFAAGGLTNTNIGIAFGQQAMTWSFTMTSSNNLSVTSTGRDGSNNIVFRTNVTVAASPDAFRWYVSAMGAGDQRQPYFNNLQIADASGGISNVPIYVRLATNAPVAEATNSLFSRVTISSTNAANVFVDLSGSVEDRPSVSAAPGAINNLITTNGYASAPADFTVTGRNLSNNVTLAVTPTNANSFQVSTNGLDWTNFLSFAPATNRAVSNSVQVRITATAPVTNSLGGNLAVATDGALSGAKISLLGIVLPDTNIPVVTSSTSALSGLGSVEGSPGISTNFVVSGTFLRGPITVAATNSFIAVSTNNLDFGSAVSVPRDGNNQVLSNTVYVRITQFAPISANTNVFLGNLVLGTTRNSNNLPASTNVAVSGTVTNWSIANPYGIRVTNPVDFVSTNGTNFIFRGQIGAAVDRDTLSWFNLLNNQSNSFGANTNLTWSVSAPLGIGNNTFVFKGQFLTNSGVTNVASDAAGDSAYAPPGGWVSGDNGGYGFGSWQLYAEEGLSALYRTDEWASTNMNVSAFNGFAFESLVGAVATAYRPFLAPIQAPGGSFSVRFDSNDLEPGGAVGMQLVSSNQTPLFTFAASNNGSGPAYQISDATNAAVNPGWPYTQSGLLLRFEMTSSNAYSLTVTGSNFTNTSKGTISDSSVAGVTFFTEGAGPVPAANFYVGQMMQNRTIYEIATVETVAPDVERTSAPPATAYDLWAGSYGLNPAGNGAPTADPDKDGFVNDMEFAFGTSPVLANGALLNVTQSDSSMVVTFIARIANVSYSVMQKANLATNVPAWAETGIVPTAASDQSGVPADYERRLFSVPASGQNFYRVRAAFSP